uniref:Lebercilin LCA5 n=1 Tax=Sander lucioperca TaxID=283035 RepID=A0A8C9XZN4_SANLU
MESENISDPYQDNRDVIQSPQSLQSTKEDPESKTRTCHSDPDRDQVSDGEGQRSSRSFYSEDYENESPSDRSISPYSQSRTPSPTPQRGVRAKRIYNSPLYKTVGVGRRGVSRPQRPGGQPLSQQHRRGMHSQSKESTPPKDLDLVTKRMLSARLLKINELRNSLAELQQRTDELQKENRVLRQLQVRQEKALHRYDDTESEISQLLSRHNNETHVLRERLRRTQERERAAERRMKDSEEQLQRSQGTIARLKKLVDQRELGTRDELSRRLEEEKTRAQEAERKIKELERSMELSSSSYQRQLAAERKKTISAQEEIRTLQEELERLTNKLKEKERELDAKNIYANRVMKPALRKDVDSGTKRKGNARYYSTKAVQTQDRTSSVDFPTPPPAITDANEYIEHAPDEYLSLKVKSLHFTPTQAETEDRHQKWEQQKTRDREKDRDKEEELVKEKDKELEREEKRQLKEELNVLEEKANRLRDGWEKTKEEEDRKRTSSLLNQEEENKRKRGHVQEEVQRWNQEVLANQQAAAEARRKKEQLLAKMREIDGQDHGTQDTMFAESSPSKATSNYSSPQQKNLNSSFFNHTESEDSARVGRRAPRPQISSDDLAFGSYAPSFGRSASRGSSGFPPPPGSGKERKSSLMQQLFGALATPACDSVSTSNKMEVLNSPTTNGVRSRREGLLSFNSGSSTPPASSLNTLHVAESRPAIRAITSFDDDIEELTL